MEKTLYDFSVMDNQNNVFDFAQLRGKTVLIVNTASKCGFTTQYEALESLYKKYKDQGLCVIGFPCNQFGGQEPGSNEEIASFCTLNFGVTFPLMKKVDVNGKDASPVFTFLKSKSSSFWGSRIKWNFTKFLISSDGKTIQRYSPTTKPESFEEEILSMLQQPK